MCVCWKHGDLVGQQYNNRTADGYFFKCDFFGQEKNVEKLKMTSLDFL